MCCIRQTEECYVAGNIAGFKHVQLELYRQAAQDLLARLAPDLAAQLLTIFKALSKQPALAATDAPTIPSMQQQSGSTVPDCTVPESIAAASAVPASVTIAADSAAAAEASFPLGDGIPSTYGLSYPAALSQVDLSATAAVETKFLTISFSDTFTLPLLSGANASDMTQSLRSPGSFSSAHIPTERPSRLSLLPSALPIEGSLAGSTGPSVAAAVQHSPRGTASVRAQAWQMQQQIEQDAKHAHLVVLQPQEAVQHSSHVLVMRGSVKLEGCPVNNQLLPGGSYSIFQVDHTPACYPFAPRPSIICFCPLISLIISFMPKVTYLPCPSLGLESYIALSIVAFHGQKDSWVHITNLKVMDYSKQAILPCLCMAYVKVQVHDCFTLTGQRLTVEFASPSVLPWVPTSKHAASSTILTASIKGKHAVLQPSACAFCDSDDACLLHYDHVNDYLSDAGAVLLVAPERSVHG